TQPAAPKPKQPAAAKPKQPATKQPATRPRAAEQPIAVEPPAPELPPDEFDDVPGPPQPETIDAPSGDPATSAPAMRTAPAEDSGDDAPAPGDAESPKSAPAVITPEAIAAFEEAQREAERANPKKWRHAGLIFEFMIGTQGCTRSYCKGEDNLNAKPGLRLNGFLGRNTFGILDIGLELGWGTLTPGDVNGLNAADIYDLDPQRLQDVLNERLGIDLFDFDLSQAVTTTVKLRTVNAGPSLRIHVLPRGRYDPYVGVGFHYHLWRARYETLSGPARLDFHGVALPLQLGFNVFVHPNVAVGARFDYDFTYYFLANLDHPDASGFTIVSVLDEAAADTTVENPTQEGLPRFWGFTLGARGRF
ncbi:MAG: hypothetical protein KC468_04390, partial [Myxococcales bacterium]|nr:hypothetical protein [Myxococcales bacterium]